MTTGAPGRARRDRALVLWLLTAVFFLRVLGQALVTCFEVGVLPPMAAWYSGLLPYPVLLPVQALILAAQIAIDRHVWRGDGFFAGPRPRWGRALRWVSYGYGLAMLVRYLVTRSHAIPVFFHEVLATYLFVLAGVHLPATAGAPARRGEASES
jgi:hypothetical protein